MLISYVWQNKINQSDNDSDCLTIAIAITKKSTTFDQSNFYVERDYPHYLITD